MAIKVVFHLGTQRYFSIGFIHSNHFQYYLKHKLL
jgi:hypothetical protein